VGEYYHKQKKNVLLSLHGFREQIMT